MSSWMSSVVGPDRARRPLLDGIDRPPPPETAAPEQAAVLPGPRLPEDAPREGTDVDDDDHDDDDDDDDDDGLP